MSPRQPPEDWAEWAPAEHWREAQRLIEQARSGDQDPLGMAVTEADLHVQIAQAKSTERLVALLAGRIQYVDTRPR